MPVTVYHTLTATTPDDPAYEIRPSHWNASHTASMSAAGVEIAGAFSNGGNVSFGLDIGGHITGQAPSPGGAQTAISGLMVSNTTYTSGTVTFVNSNGISFGSAAGQAITASYNSTQFAGSGFTSTSVTGSLMSATLNSAGLSVKIPAWLTNASGGTGGASSLALGVSGTGNTVGQSATSSYPLSSIPIAGKGIISVGNSGGYYVISGPSTVALPQISVGDSTGEAGDTGLVTGQLVLVGGSNITLSGNTNAGSMTITIDGGAGGGGGIKFGVSSLGNTSSETGTISAGNAAFVGVGAITLVQNKGSNTASNVTISWSAPDVSSLSATGIASLSTNGSTISIGVPPLTISNSAGSFTASQVKFADANNVTWGTSAGSIITASVDAGGSQSVQTQASGNIARTGFTTTATAGTAVVATHDTAGLKMGVPPFITTWTAPAAQTTQTQASGDIARTGFTTTATAGTAVVATHDTAGLKMGVPPFITTWTAPAAQTTQTQPAGNIAGAGFTSTSTAGSVLVGTLNSSGISLGVPAWITVAAGGAGVAISASDSVFTSGTVSLNQSGALTIGTGAQAINFSVPGTSSLSATGIVSLSTNGSTISVGVPALTISNSAGSFSASQVLFTNANGVTWGTSAGSIITASVNSTSNVGLGTTITGGASITLASNGMSFNGTNLAGVSTAVTGGASITVNSSGINFNGTALAGTVTAITGKALITLNSSGLSFNGTSLAGTGTSVASTTGNYSMQLNSTGLTLSVPYRTRVIWPDQELTAVTAPTNASMSFVYFPAYVPLTATRLEMLIGMSFSTTAGAGTQTLQQSAYAVIYTKNAASLSSLSSGSTQTTWTMASNTAGQTQLSQAAIRYVSVPINVNMAPGEYYIGVNYITAGTAVSMTHSIYGGNEIQTASNFADMASQTNATTGQLLPGMGCYSAASTGMPAALSLSAILQTGVNLSAANIALVLRNA